VSKARNPAFTAETQKQIGRLQAEGWYHSIRFPDGHVTRGHQSEDQLRTRLAQFPIPQDLTGKRILDIGAWDGWFSFEMERRGATVVAVDVREYETFLQARAALGSKVEYRIDDVVDITPERYGYFDIVLFLGVLYHLKHPLLALERVCALSTDIMCVESYVTNASPDAAAAMEFYEQRELCGQFDNWVGPNLACLLAFCRTAGFARVDLKSVLDQRAHVACYRKWADRTGAGEAPVIVAVENSLRGGTQFERRADEYASLWFKSGAQGLTCDTVFPRVGEFGVRPAIVDSTGGDGWLVNFVVPPGLEDGWHDVQVAVADSRWSNAAPMALGLAGPAPEMPQAGGPLEIAMVTDGKTWEHDRVRSGPGACVSLWVRGLVGSDVEIMLDGRSHPVTFVSRPDAQGLVQVNAMLPPDVVAGSLAIGVRSGAVQSPLRLVVVY